MKNLRKSLSRPRTRSAGRNSSAEFEKKLNREGPQGVSGCRRKQSQSTTASKKHARPKTESATPPVGGHALPKVHHGDLRGLIELLVRLWLLFGRIERLADRIDGAFAGQLFFPDLPPEARANRRRFYAYFDLQTQVSRLMSKAIELWMTACAIKQEDDRMRLLIEDRRR